MIIKYRQNAVNQMSQRKITVQEVELIINAYDGQPIVQSIDKRVFYKNIKGRKDNLIAVVVLINPLDPEIMEVLTVMVGFEVRK